MDYNRNVDNFPDTSLVLLSFLKQKGCQNTELKTTIDDLEQQLTLELYRNHRYIDNDDEELVTDGQSPQVSYRDLLHDLQGQVQPQLSVNAGEARAAREMAAELIRIGDLLEQRVLLQAAQSLTAKLDPTKEQTWAGHLSEGVQALFDQVAGAREFKKELVEMAFTFMLLKTVCERVPSFLYCLYGTVVQCFKPH